MEMQIVITDAEWLELVTVDYSELIGELSLVTNVPTNALTALTNTAELELDFT